MRSRYYCGKYYSFTERLLFFVTCFLLCEPIWVQEALYHGFWFRAQKVLAIWEEIYVDKCSLYFIWFKWNHWSLWIIYSFLFNSLWFPTTNGVKVFRCPGTKTFVHIYAGLWMMSIQWGVFQLDVELHLLVENLFSSIFAEAYEKIFFCGHISPHLALIWREEWFIRYLHSFWHFTAGI